MSHEEREKIECIVDNILRTEQFKKHQKCYEALLQDNGALAAIEEYRTIRAEYIDATLAHSLSVNKDELRKLIQIKRQELNKVPLVNDYFSAARKVELFIDDLNYEIGTVIGTKNKKSCHA